MTLAIVWNPVTVDDPNELRAELKRRDVGSDLLWLETTEDDPGAGQTRHALDAGAEMLVVCGGDGTVAACAGVLAGTGVPMALVPTGTGNLLVRNLGLPLDVPTALDRAFSADRRTVDLLDVGGRRFTVMAGMGFDAALIRDTGEQAKKRYGWVAYVAAGMGALRNTPRAHYELRVDASAPRRIRALGVLVGNVGELQGGMAVLPDADPSDGLVDVIVIAPRGWLDVVLLAWRILRRRPDKGPQALIAQGRRIEIRAGRLVPVEFDGDYAGEQETLTVTVLPGAVTICGAR
ncbi:MAG TPA: diacylglycerol kinase family protein [Jatrophihabitantaceae bacterium]